MSAARRIAEASGYAADMLAEFMADPDVDLKTRTQIAQDLLNRAGLSGKSEIEISATLTVPEWEAKMLSHIRPVVTATPDDPDGARAIARVQRQQLAHTSYGQRTGEYGQPAETRIKKVYRGAESDEDVVDAEIVEGDEDDLPVQTRHDRRVFADVESGRAARQQQKRPRTPRPAGEPAPRRVPEPETPDWYAEPPTRASDNEWAESGRARARRSPSPSSKRKPGQGNR
jgi:hypothetical protein